MNDMLKAVFMLAVLTGTQQASGAGAAASPSRRIAIDVTNRGFEPSSIHVKAGRPVVLVVTRRTEQTCAKEIVIEGQEMRRALPLNQAIEIRLSAKKARTLRFACGMDMLGGTVVIE